MEFTSMTVLVLNHNTNLVIRRVGWTATSMAEEFFPSSYSYVYSYICYTTKGKNLAS